MTPATPVASTSSPPHYPDTGLDLYDAGAELLVPLVAVLVAATIKTLSVDVWVLGRSLRTAVRQLMGRKG